jgi:hypothetical protein
MNLSFFSLSKIFTHFGNPKITPPFSAEGHWDPLNAQAPLAKIVIR